MHAGCGCWLRFRFKGMAIRSPIVKLDDVVVVPFLLVRHLNV